MGADHCLKECGVGSRDGGNRRKLADVRKFEGRGKEHSGESTASAKETGGDEEKGPDEGRGEGTLILGFTTGTSPHPSVLCQVLGPPLCVVFILAVRQQREGRLLARLGTFGDPEHQQLFLFPSAVESSLLSWSQGSSELVAGNRPEGCKH